MNQSRTTEPQRNGLVSGLDTVRAIFLPNGGWHDHNTTNFMDAPCHLPTGHHISIPPVTIGDQVIGAPFACGTFGLRP